MDFMYPITSITDETNKSNNNNNNNNIDRHFKPVM